ncbi:MAG: T9SS type A sorting domain-containing protein [Bacteroidia bacterium]|nr:T9SS type A sorting domain-containing protein [Bacteroidia bacterium]
MTYQWYSNPTESNMGGTSLGSGNGAQTSVYTPQATTAGTLYYYCIVSGSCGSPATSAISGAFLVNPVTSITSQSTLAQTQCVGGTFSAISVTATGAGLTYQWYSNTSAVNSGGTQMDPSNGAQTSTYTPQAASAGTLYYYCIVSGTCGSLTSAISEAFLVNLPTTIISQSTEGQTRCIGGIFTPISVTATGVGLTYQWYSNTSAGNMGGSSLGSVNGSQTNTYTPQAGAAGTLYYYCIVSGTCGSVTSAISGPFVVNPATAINSQSTAEQTQCIGGTFTSISVTATGVGLTYQWYSNTSSSTLGGSSLNSGNGAQTNTYTPQATAAGTLYYYCIVSGTCGSATSAISGAFLVNPATAISSQSTAEQTRCIGGTFTSISVTATSVGLTYQWYSNTNASILGGSSLNADNGAQTSSYTPQATSVGTLYYYCIVSGTCGSATSAISGAFVVDPATAINSQSTAQQTRCIGGTFTSISVTATGVGLTYQWYSNASASTSGGSSLNSGNGAQTNTYTPQATAAGTLYFYCIISGTCGSVTSEISGAFLVNPATAISSQSTAGQTQCMGKSFNSISVTATGLGLTYQWYSNTIQSTIGGASLGSGDGGQSNTYTPQINAAGTLYYYCIVSGSCGSVTSAISGAFLVNPTPSATIIYTGSPYCYNAGFVAVYQTGTLGGSYSSAPAGLTLNAGTGEINTNASNPGSYTVTYTISPAGGCDIFTTTTEVSIIGDLIWTGSVSSDWNVSGNWFCGVIPDLTTNVHIPKVTNNPILSGGLAGAAKNIVIDNESSLTVEGNTIQISGAITNSGIFTATAGTIDMKGSVNQVIGADVFAGNTIMNLIIDNPAGVTLLGPLNITGILNALAGNLLSGGNLTLISTQTQTALIDGSGTGEVLGNATMQRYLPSAFGYKYFSSPFQTATVNEFADDMDLGALFPTFYMYNEKHLSPAGAEMSGWTTYTSPTGILNPSEGYAVNFGPVSSAKTADITGVVNNGSLSVNLWNHNSTYTLGYNLVGNPYPSPIDWNKPGWTKTNIDNAIYFFNAGNTNQYLGVYTSYVNGVSTGNGSNIIASMQGFFIHVADGTYPVSATFGVTNTVRTNDLNPLFKTAYIDDREILRFAANFETQNAIEDMAVVYFDRNATRSFEGDMDALKMTNTDILVPNLYSFSSESKQLSINGMPFPADSITKIPLGLTTFSDGWISFTAKDISRLQANMNIYLVDAEKGITQDLEQYPEYRFNLKAGAYNQRFSLVFSLSQIDNPLDITEKMFRVLPWNDILLVKVNLPLNTKGNLLVTNMGGQILLQRDVFEKETVEINPSSSSGVYIITVISGKRIQSEKLLMRLNYE